MGDQLFPEPPEMQNKMFLKKSVWAMWKCMVTMATRNAILKNGFIDGVNERVLSVML